MLAVGLAIRFFLAPLSASGDIKIFWSSGKALLDYGWRFYEHADHVGTEPFVYPPVWLLINGAAYALSPTIDAFDPAFRTTIKTPIILADAYTTLLIFRFLGNNQRGVIGSGIWILNPMTIFMSGVFGQFDSIPLAFLLTSLVFLRRRQNHFAGLFGGLCLVTKQYFLFPLIPLSILLARKSGLRGFITQYAPSFLVTVLLIQVPFMLADLHAYLYFTTVAHFGSGHAISGHLFSGVYQFIGLLTDNREEVMRTVWYASVILMTGSVLGVSVFAAKFLKTDFEGYISASLLGILVFLTFGWKIDGQYTLSLIPFAVIHIMRKPLNPRWHLVSFLQALAIPFSWGIAIYFESYGYADEAIASFFRPLAIFLAQPDQSWLIGRFLTTGSALVFLVLLLLFLSKIVGTEISRRHVWNPYVVRRLSHQSSH